MKQFVRWNRGSVSMFFLPFSILFFVVSILVWDIGLWFYTSERVQSMADAVLISSIRVRAEGLQKIAERWGEFGQFFQEGFPNKEVFVPSVHWSFVKTEAASLKQAVPGYKGRITSVINVAAEANGFDSQSAFFEDDEAQKLGVVSETLTMRDELGQTQSLAGGWYRREWAPEEWAPQPPEKSAYRVLLKSPIIGAVWAGSAKNLWRGNQIAKAGLRWDVDSQKIEVQQQGNGGYPRDWDQVLMGNQVVPFRFPLFEARLE